MSVVTVSGPPVHAVAVLDELERRAREFETRAGECRDAAATLRRFYQISTIVPEAAVEAAPSAHRRRAVPHVPDEDPAYVPEANGNDRRQRESSRQSTEPSNVADSTWRQDMSARSSTATGIAAPLPTTAQVVDIMRVANRPLSGTDLWNSLPSPRPTSGRFRQQLQRLVVSGAIRRTGHTRYELPDQVADVNQPQTPAVHKPEPVPPSTVPAMHEKPSIVHAPATTADSDLEPAKPTALPPGLTLDAFKARLARFVLTEVNWTKPRHSGDLTLLIHDKWGAAPFDVLDAVLGELVDLGELERTKEPGTYARVGHTKAQLPPLKAVEAAAAAPAMPEIVVSEQLLEGLDRILATGASYDVRELVRNLRQRSEDIGEERLLTLLEQLQRQRRIERVSLMQGGTPRWRKLAGVSVRAKARASA